MKRRRDEQVSGLGRFWEKELEYEVRERGLTDTQKHGVPSPPCPGIHPFQLTQQFTILAMMGRGRMESILNELHNLTKVGIKRSLNITNTVCLKKKIKWKI